MVLALRHQLYIAEKDKDELRNKNVVWNREKRALEKQATFFRTNTEHLEKELHVSLPRAVH